MAKTLMYRVAVGCLVLLVVPVTTWGAFPSVEDMSVTGNLVAGQSSTMQVSCTAFEIGGTITSVAVNLSQIGGSDSVALAGNGDQWTGSATVTPSTSDAGIRCVTFTATDSIDSTAIGSIPVGVRDPNLTITGSLIEGKNCQLTVSYTPTGGVTDAQSVTVDLSRIGGPADVSLSAGSSWTWTGSVTPPVKGVASVPCIVTRTSATMRRLSAAAVAPPEIVVRVPGLRSEILIPAWIESNRLVQNHTYQNEGGWDCRITVECAASVLSQDAGTVEADLTQIGVPGDPVSHRVTLEKPLGSSIWTWTGEATPSSSGLKNITIHGAQKTVSRQIGVVDSRLLYADWVFLYGGPYPEAAAAAPEDDANFLQYVGDLANGLAAANLPVVLLGDPVWRGLPDNYLQYLVGALSAKTLADGTAITVGFHCCAPETARTNQEPDDLIALNTWLHGTPGQPGSLGIIERLAKLDPKPKIVYADGSPWLDVLFYLQTLRGLVGPEGIVLEGDIELGPNRDLANQHFVYIDGSTTGDQGDTAHTYFFGHPRQYADWRIGRLLDYRSFVPPWTRLEVGWIGECVEWWVPVPDPLPDGSAWLSSGFLRVRPHRQHGG